MSGREMREFFVAPGRDEADWVTKRQRRIRTSETLLAGALLGMVGLFTCLFLAMFRSQCDATHRLPMYIDRQGESKMCMASVADHVTDTAVSNDESYAIRIPNKDCRTDTDCEGSTFCAGGTDGLKEADFCLTGECSCQDILFGCGTRNFFQFEFKPVDVLQDCSIVSHWTAAAEASTLCSTTQTLNLGYWKDPAYTRTPWNGGCEYYVKNDLHSCMKYVEKHLESIGLLSPLKPATDPIWIPVTEHLENTSDIVFGSFWPSTISESVSQLTSPSSRIFLGFMLLSSLCLIVSGYTYECESVDLVDRTIPILNMEANALRQYLPPIGLTLLALVPMKPTSEIYNVCDVAMTAVHLCGAQFCFVVFLACEALALHDEDNTKDMTDTERRVRNTITAVGLTAMAFFGMAYGILTLFSGGEDNPYVSPPFGGYSDLYHKDDFAKTAVLVRPAEGFWKFLKVLSYTAEFTVALTLLADLLVVWFYFSKSIWSKDHQGGADDQDVSDEEGTS